MDLQCTLLDGLKVVDLREDAEALHDLTLRLEPIVGNLTRGFGETAFAKFVIDCWKNPNCEPGYGIIKFAPLQPV
jgi:hypothetical protein